MQWQRIFRQRGFYFAVVIQIFAYLYPHMDTHVFWQDPLEYFGSADLLYFFLMPRTHGLCMILLPFIAVLPSAAFIAEDQESGYIRYVLQRSGRHRYFAQRTVQAIGGAACASIIGSLVYLGFIMIVCPWNDNIIESWRMTLARGSFARLSQHAYGFPLIADTILQFALEAMTWSLIGIAFASLTHSSGLTLALTFMLHYGITYTLETFPQTYSWSPVVIAAEPIGTQVPLLTITAMQVLYFGIAFVIALISMIMSAKRLAVTYASA